MSLSLNIKKGLFEYSQDAGKMLLHTATLGWILSALGQIYGIANNEKVSKKEKKFLIPQEVADAAVNILSFYLVTNSVQNFTKSLAAKGKVITPEILAKCEEFGIKLGKDANGKSINIGDAISAKIKEYKVIVDNNKNEKLNIDNKTITDLNIKIDKLKDFKNEKYGPFESGLRIIGNVIGAIVSGNIITPMLRNPMAAYKQKSAIEREKIEKEAKLYRESQGKDKPNPYYAKRVILGSSSMRI